MSHVVAVGETPLRIEPAGRTRFETASEAALVASGIESDVAIAARRMGADATWYSKLPANPTGRRVSREIRQFGVDADPVTVADGTVGTVVAERGAHPRSDVTVTDRADAAAATLEPGELPMDDVQAADVVFCSGSTMALSETAAETVSAVLRAASGSRTAFDLAFEETLTTPEQARETVTRTFDSVDVLTARATDVRRVLDEDGQPQQLAHALASSYDFEMVVVRRADGEAVVWHDDVIHDRSPVETETVDASGDHSAFLGAFLERLAADDTAEEALTWAVAAGALARTVPGPLFSVTHEEVAAVREELGDGATGY
ncbi:MAG: PfkB family carbohydrate kinase [Halococcoides sp.]